MSGKGDAPRPLSVPPATFADRWAQTFDDGIVYRAPLAQKIQAMVDAVQQKDPPADPPA